MSVNADLLRMPAVQIQPVSVRPDWNLRFKTYSRFVALVVTIVGVVVLLGWTFEVRALKSILPGFAVMKPNTAVGFLCSGIALWFLSHLGEGASRRAALAFAAVPLLIGALTLFEYITGQNLGIDMILFSKAPDLLKLSPPGRMTHVAATNLTLLGAAMLMLLQRRPLLAQLLSLPAMGLAILAIVGYVLGAGMLYKMTIFSSMALHTACSFLLLATAICFTAEARCWGGWTPTRPED